VTMIWLATKFRSCSEISFELALINIVDACNVCVLSKIGTLSNSRKWRTVCSSNSENTYGQLAIAEDAVIVDHIVSP
jgi:hypothetical protein